MSGTRESDLTQHAGRAVSRLGFVLGTAASVLANILAQRIHPLHAPQGWAPNGQAEIGAIYWPISLLITVEMLVRVRWTDRKLHRFALLTGVGAVLLFSSIISYSHIVAVLESWQGYDSLSVHTGPLAIDGLMTVSGLALLVISQQAPATLGVPSADLDARAVAAPEQTGAVRENTLSPRTAPVTTQIIDTPPVAKPRPKPIAEKPVAVKPVAPKPMVKREVVDIAEGVNRRGLMFAYLDENPDATGAELDQVFDTKNYGRSIVRAWRNQALRQASGE